MSLSPPETGLSRTARSYAEASYVHTSQNQRIRVTACKHGKFLNLHQRVKKAVQPQARRADEGGIMLETLSANLAGSSTDPDFDAGHDAAPKEAITGLELGLLHAVLNQVDYGLAVVNADTRQLV